MKRLDELGVSPTPWKVDVIGDPEYPVVKCGDGLVLQHCSGVWCLKDARLIAAAPDLYECLREAVEEKCGWCARHGDKKPEVCAKCDVPRWRKALEKAGG